MKKELLQPGAVTFGLDLSLGSYVTNRAFQTSRDALDGILSGQLGLSLVGRRWRIGYRGGLSAYLSNNQLTGQQHQLMAETSFTPAWTRGVATFKLGGGLHIEDHVDMFEAYDQIRSEAHLGVVLRPATWLHWEFTSTTGYAHYFQTNEFGHVYQRLSLLGVVSLPSGTRLRWRGDWTFRAFTITPGNMAGSAHIDTDVTASHRLRLSLALSQRFGYGFLLQVQGGLVPHVNDMTRFHDGLATTRALVAGGGSLGPGEPQLDALNVISGGDAGVALHWSPLGEKKLRLSLRGQWQMRHYFGHAVALRDGLAKDRVDHVLDAGVGLSWRLPVNVAGVWGDGLYLNASYSFRLADSNDATYAYQQHLIYLGIGTRWR